MTTNQLSTACIGKSKFTIEFVLQKLLDAGIQNCKLENLESFSAKDITNGEAFFSIIYSVTFKWKTSVKLSNVIIKIPQFVAVKNVISAAPEKDRASIQKKLSNYLELCHGTEINSYEFLTTSDRRINIPRYFYGHPYSFNDDKGVLMIEDLSVHSKTIGVIPGLTNAQIENVTKEIANYHAFSLKNRDWLKYDTFTVETITAFKNEFKITLSLLLDIGDEHLNDLIPKILNLCTDENIQKYQYKTNKFGIPPLLVHSDLWAPNILWQIDEQGNVTDTLSGIIDWQCATAGNPLGDIGRILAVNTSADYRRQNTDRLLELYYDAFEESYGKPLSFTIKNIREAYDASLVYISLFFGYGAKTYYNMGSVVDNPADPEKQNELLSRLKAVFEDTLKVTPA